MLRFDINEWVIVGANVVVATIGTIIQQTPWITTWFVPTTIAFSAIAAGLLASVKILEHIGVKRPPVWKQQHRKESDK